MYFSDLSMPSLRLRLKNIHKITFKKEIYNRALRKNKTEKERKRVLFITF